VLQRLRNNGPAGLFYSMKARFTTIPGTNGR
jgi:hypothetical protein